MVFSLNGSIPVVFNSNFIKLIITETYIFLTPLNT